MFPFGAVSSYDVQPVGDGKQNFKRKIILNHKHDWFILIKPTMANFWPSALKKKWYSKTLKSLFLECLIKKAKQLPFYGL